MSNENQENSKNHRGNVKPGSVLTKLLGGVFGLLLFLLFGPGMIACGYWLTFVGETAQGSCGPGGCMLEKTTYPVGGVACLIFGGAVTIFGIFGIIAMLTPRNKTSQDIDNEQTSVTMPTSSATAPVPLLQLTEEQIEQKISSIRKSLESGVEPEFSLPTPQEGGSAVCFACSKVTSKQELLYCKEQDFYIHQHQKCFDKLNSKIEGETHQPKRAL